MTAIPGVLLEITIYSAILYGTLLIFKKLFRKHISAALNYAVWMLLIIRLLVPITINSGFSLIMLPAPAAAIMQQADNDNTVHSEPVTNAADSQQASSADMPVNAQVDVKPPNTEQTAAITPSIQTMDWQTALILLWAAGMLCSFVFAVVSAKRLKRQMKRSRRDVPAYILDIIEECRNDLHIKRSINVTMHDWLHSPALTASLRPALLLSSNLLTMDPRQVEFGIRHELTHYKHRDHLMILLLILLRCIHWFNPVVWLAFPQIQTDMETLCDTGVTSGFQKTERSIYIHTMVELSRSKGVRYVLGMGQGRKMLEKRIKGMFLKQKTKLPVRVAALILSFVLVFSCFTTACQPTPAHAVVVNKDMQQMLDKAKAPHESGISLKERLSIPDRFTGTAQDEAGKFTAKMDAEIVIPDVNDIPIVRVQAQPFDHGIVEKIKDYFFDDGPFYNPDALYEETKTEFIDILAKLKARKAELEGKGMKPLHPELESGEKENEQSSPQSDASNEAVQMSAYNMLDMVNESIHSIQKKLPTALEQKNKIEVPDNWQTVSGASHYMCFAQINPDGGMRTLSADDRNDFLYITNRKDFDPSYGFYDTEESWYAHYNPDMFPAEIAEAQSLSFPSITMEQAQQTADDFLKQVGIEGFVCERNEKVIGGSGQTYGDHVLRGKLLKGYRLQYVRQVNGVPLTYTDDEAASGEQDEQSFFYWRYERITFIINDSGIAELQWTAPYTVQDTVVNSAAMLPFSDIADIFNDKITVINDWLDIEGFDITITNVRLGFMRVIEQNGNKQGLLIPVWDFFGTYTEYVDRNGEKYTTQINCPTRSYLTINAIDGAVIDRQKGY